MASLLLRNLFFTLLQPGVVAGLVPYFLVKNTPHPGPFGAAQWAGLALGLAGFCLMVACILRFASEGRGTLSPADPTRRLVARGPYRLSRNPMYLGVMGILAGECLFFGSVALVAYSAAVLVAFHLFIVFREEPRLRRDFGEEYEAFCQRTRRWV